MTEVTPVVRRIEVVHIGAAAGLPVLQTIHEYGCRYVRVPRQCLDCSGRPETIPPAEGFSAAILLIHDASCPLFLGAVRRLAEGAA